MLDSLRQNAGNARNLFPLLVFEPEGERDSQ